MVLRCKQHITYVPIGVGVGSEGQIVNGNHSSEAECWHVELKVKVAFWVADSCEETRVHNTCTAYMQCAHLHLSNRVFVFVPENCISVKWLGVFDALNHN